MQPSGAAEPKLGTPAGRQTAVADRPIRIAAAEAAVRGLCLADAAGAARAAVTSAIHPIDDVCSTASYRREVAGNLVARFFDR